MCDSGTRIPLTGPTLRVSVASCRLPFNGCEPAYIRDVCHGACCRSGTIPMDTLITVQAWEQDAIQDHGGVVVGGCLQTDGKRCQFQAKGSELCGLHNTGAKPFGCTVAPWCLSKRGTLIVHNRYKMLKCFKDGRKIPAYSAFADGLRTIFGAAQYQALAQHVASGSTDDWWGTPVPRSLRTLVADAQRRAGKQLPVLGQGQLL